MAKNKGGKPNGKSQTSSTQQQQKSTTPATAAPVVTAGSAQKGKSKATDEFRQAVKDLGGDEEDLALLEGIDEDDAEPSGSSKGPSAEEAALKKELGKFMKGLDFASFAQQATADADEDEEEDEGEDEDEDEEDEDDDDEEEDEEDEDEDEDEEDDVAVAEVKAPTSATVVATKKDAVASTATTDTPASRIDDPSPESATKVPGSRYWPDLLPPLPPLSAPLEPVPPFKLNGLRSRAQNLLDKLPPLPRASSSSDAAFINQVLTSGTHQDKLSALILLVRESPIHAVKELNRLRNMTGYKEDGGVGGSGGNKDQRIAAVRALSDWWVNGGGKENGKLKYFADQPLLGHPELTDRHLLVYAFEDYLKKWFFNLLQVVEVLSHDTLPFIRTQALNITFQLMAGNAEQEHNLLRLGVNKLGDNDKSVASKASHHILQLLQRHPFMKAIIAREVSALILKPVSAAAAPAASTHVRFDEAAPAPKPKAKKPEAKPEGPGHARYYGLITLNQMQLSNQDQEVAGRLIELYFEVFREVLGEGIKADKEKEGEEENAEEQIEKVAGKVEKWRGRRKGAKPRGGRKTALEDEELVGADEAKLVTALLTGINRALPYAHLDEEMFSNYMETLFKITHAGTFNTSIQALQLILQISQARQTVSDRFYRTLYDSLYDTRLVTSSKQAMYLNLLFKAIKADDKSPRVKAFVKRLLQMLSLHQPPFICGALYLLGELFQSTPGLKRMLIEPEDDDEEHFVDADKAGTANGQTSASSSKAPREDAYDGKKRDPQYANADQSCLWELLPFVDHFHPSVSLQASQILMSQPPTGSADISLNTLVSFLDRFVYRNPKKQVQPKGASVMQPAAASDKSGMVVMQKGARSTEDGFVNSEKFWRKKIEEVPVDQLFFHKFFSSKLAQKEVAAKKKKRGEEDTDASDEDEEVVGEGEESEDDDVEEEGEDEEEVEDDDDEEFSDPEEAEIWKAMKASMPGAGEELGLSDEDDSDDDLDLDSDDEDDEDVEDDSDEDEDADADEEEEEEEEEEEAAPPTKKSKSKASTRGKAASPTPSLPSDDDDELFPDDDDELFPDFADEEDDLLSDADMPDIPFAIDGSSDEEEDEVSAQAAKKRKRGDERKERKKKRKEMPMFGSYEDYAAMIDAAGNEGED